MYLLNKQHPHGIIKTACLLCFKIRTMKRDFFEKKVGCWFLRPCFSNLVQILTHRSYLIKICSDASARVQFTCNKRTYNTTIQKCQGFKHTVFQNIQSNTVKTNTSNISRFRSFWSVFDQADVVRNLDYNGNSWWWELLRVILYGSFAWIAWNGYQLWEFQDRIQSCKYNISSTLKSDVVLRRFVNFKRWQRNEMFSIDRF